MVRNSLALKHWIFKSTLIKGYSLIVITGPQCFQSHYKYMYICVRFACHDKHNDSSDSKVAKLKAAVKILSFLL